MRRLCAECGTKQVHGDNDMCKDCDPIIRNPLALNDDALGENPEPQTDDGEETIFWRECNGF